MGDRFLLWGGCFSWLSYFPIFLRSFLFFTLFWSLFLQNNDELSLTHLNFVYLRLLHQGMYNFYTPPIFLYSSSMRALPNSSRRWQYKEKPQHFARLPYPRQDEKNELNHTGGGGYKWFANILVTVKWGLPLVFYSRRGTQSLAQGHTKKHVPDPRLWGIEGPDCFATIWACLWNQAAKFSTSHFRSPACRKEEITTPGRWQQNRSQ